MQITLVQQEFKGSIDATIKHTLKRIKEAADAGAELVLLQELHCSEYFCQSEDVRYFAYAENFARDVEVFGAAAKINQVVLVASLFEKRAPGIYHNTAVVFEKDGSIAGEYRKSHIPDDPGFYEKFYFTEGDSGFEPITTSIGVLGVLVCWDQWYPEAARIMALKGAEILIYPTAIGWFESDDADEKHRQLDAWMTIQRSHAIANGLHLCAINRVGFEEDASGAQEGIRFWGNSFVCGPQGEVLGVLGEEDGLLDVTIDTARMKEVRDIWPFFRDRRIDLYNGLDKRYLKG